MLSSEHSQRGLLEGFGASLMTATAPKRPKRPALFALELKGHMPRLQIWSTQSVASFQDPPDRVLTAMGSSVSRPASLAPTFERMAGWDFKAVKRLLSEYKEKDLDFGLDAQGLAEIVGGDTSWAEAIIDAFGGTNGIVNALAFICGAVLVASGAALEKAGLVFDALDFDMTEQISMDEMTIAFLCCARGYCVMSATGKVPSDEELENVTLRAYRELSKTGSSSVTKNEFTKWVIKFISTATTARPHIEVTLQDMAVQFGLVEPPPIAKSITEEVLSELASDVDPAHEIQNPIAEKSVSVVDVPVETTVDKDHLYEDEGFDSARTASADAAEPNPVAYGDCSDLPVGAETLAQHNDYEEEFQQETPRDAPENESGRPSSALFEPAQLDGETPAELSRVDEPLTGDQNASPEGAGDSDPGGEAMVQPDDLPETDEPADLNAYDSYDYTNPIYDCSSGLPPPESPHQTPRDLPEETTTAPEEPTVQISDESATPVPDEPSTQESEALDESEAPKDEEANTAVVDQVEENAVADEEHGGENM